MNAPVRTVYVAPFGSVGKFDELERVRLVEAVKDDEGRTIMAGARGTVVAIWSDGAAYEVEFESPFHALATIEAKCLERASAE